MGILGFYKQNLFGTLSCRHFGGYSILLNFKVEVLSFLQYQMCKVNGDSSATFLHKINKLGLRLKQLLRSNN